MNNGIGMVVADEVHDSRSVGEAEVLDIDAAAINAPGFQLMNRIPAQLTGVTCDENSHSLTPHSTNSW